MKIKNKQIKLIIKKKKKMKQIQQLIEKRNITGAKIKRKERIKI
jgi:hypothetical protein